MYSLFRPLVYIIGLYILSNIVYYLGLVKPPTDRCNCPITAIIARRRRVIEITENTKP